MPPKSPFGRYTPEQIFAAEATTYVVLAGIDFYDMNGNYFFTKGSAVRHYNKIHRQLVIQSQEGTNKQRNNARRVLNNLKIQQMRIH